LLFHGYRSAKPDQESTQYASMAAADSILALVMLHESIQHLAIQIVERDMFVLKVSARVPCRAKLGHSGSGSVKVHAQRPLAEPFKSCLEE
jgi:hypothetical protein